MAWVIETYTSPAGETPLEAFNESLSEDQQAQLLAVLRALRERGNTLRLPHSRSLKEGLFELRTRTGVRVFYVFRPGRRIVLLDGMVKKRDDIPRDVLARIRALARTVPP